MKKALINEGQINNLVNALLNENEWAFHFGKDHDERPYVSDNKFQMLGRETGHFGSGTYFSTYRGNKNVDDYGDLSRNFNPNFIKVSNGVYRVDMDLYKNLYRVRSKKQGDILYTMMRNLNAFYNRICSMARFDQKEAQYNNAKYYQIIKKNSNALSLKCPSYLELTRMAQEHGKSDERVQSFSTLFMEWNGYNGVNVCGVDYYDNTKHGSVIYDLSKVDTEMEEVQPKNLYSGFRDAPYDGTIASNGYNDEEADSLKGEYIGWYKELNGMPLNRALRLLKNYCDSGKILDPFTIKDMNDELARRYLRMIYVKRPRGYWDDPIEDEMLGGKYSKYYIRLIDKYNAYYWVNYESKSKWKSVLVSLLSEYEHSVIWEDNSEELKKAYLDKLLSYMERALTKYEKNYIEKDYFDN